jgi:hypothetical protein
MLVSLRGQQWVDMKFYKKLAHWLYRLWKWEKVKPSDVALPPPESIGTWAAYKLYLRTHHKSTPLDKRVFHDKWCGSVEDRDACPYAARKNGLLCKKFHLKRHGNGSRINPGFPTFYYRLPECYGARPKKKG